MEEYRPHDIVADGRGSDRAKSIVPLRSVVKRVNNTTQIAKRRPIVRNKDGVVVWQAGEDTYYYRDEQSGRHFSCSCSIDGGVVIVLDHTGQVVEAYKLRDGETVETV